MQLQCGRKKSLEKADDGSPDTDKNVRVAELFEPGIGRHQFRIGKIRTLGIFFDFYLELADTVGAIEDDRVDRMPAELLGRLEPALAGDNTGACCP